MHRKMNTLMDWRWEENEEEEGTKINCKLNGTCIYWDHRYCSMCLYLLLVLNEFIYGYIFIYVCVCTARCIAEADHVNKLCCYDEQQNENEEKKSKTLEKCG